MRLQVEGEGRSRCEICDFVNKSKGFIEKELEHRRRTKMLRGGGRGGNKWLLSVYYSLFIYVIILLLITESPQVAEANKRLCKHQGSRKGCELQEELRQVNQSEPEEVREVGEIKSALEVEAISSTSTELRDLQQHKGASDSTSSDSSSGSGLIIPRARIVSRRAAAAYLGLKPMNELRVSGSKSEPPSRPTVDWSKQRPYFGPDMARNVSVELGKTAYLTCKVYELGDKTVSWLRPRENEILTAGRFTYIGDSRFASINDNGSHDWILEIKDVGLNDSTSYECQVSTDPKMSVIINLQVKAAKAKIKQGEQYYAPSGSNIEFTCEIGQKSSLQQSAQALPPNGSQQTYWYYNGNLLNYARSNLFEKNFSIEWDSMTQTSRFKLSNVQLSDAGNYSCKPTSAEPTTIRLHVKRINQKSGLKDRTTHSSNTKEAQKTRYSSESNSFGLESTNPNSAYSKLISSSGTWIQLTTLTTSCLFNVLLFNNYQRY